MNSRVSPLRLSANALGNPIGINDRSPVLRWELPEVNYTKPPTSWQIHVADSPEALARNEANYWDSGWIEAERMNEAAYQGRPGGSRKRLWWRVRLRSSVENVGPWSSPAWWEHGLEVEGDWSAKWITTDITGGPRRAVPAPYLRKAFSLDGSPPKARLYVTALGLYECEINGQTVGRDVFTPGWTEYRKRVQVQTYDVTALLRAGENAWGAILGDGWFCGHISSKDRQGYGPQPVFLAQLEITMPDGSVHRIVTDSSWKYSTGPILENDLIMGESYDARLELENWSLPGFREEGWLPVVEEAAPQIILTASASPPVRRQEVIRINGPLGAGAPAGKRSIFDVGQNIAGRVCITVRGPRGGHFHIRHAEMLDAHGELYVDNLRSARCTDKYTCKGGEEETWEPRFTFHGFRYVEIVFSGPDIEIVKIEAVALYSDMEQTGSFSCSQPLVNQLFQNIHWGMKGNFLEVPTDCPQRDERLGWTGDAQVFVSTAGFLRDVRGFFTKWMLDVADAQKPSGAISSVAPQIDARTGEDAGPGWSDAAIICPWEIYRVYGDRRILEQNYATMQRFIEFLRDKRCRDHIRSHPSVDPWGGHGDWLAMDGGVDREGSTPKDLIGTAYFAYDLELLSRIAGILGKTDDSIHYKAWREEVVRAFRRRFVTEDGLLVGNNQTSHVLALHFNLLPEVARNIAASELAKNIQKRSYHLSTGFLGTPYICRVLEDAGHLDVAYKLLEQETFPSWLFPVKNGATTIWERWDSWTPDKGFQAARMNSFNHYAYGAIGAWLVGTVAGIELDADQPGGSHILFRPRPGGTITQAEASWHTVRGRVAIKWEKCNDRLNLALTVPAFGCATLLPPDGYVAGQLKFGPGRHEIVLNGEVLAQKINRAS
ncbi:MAG: family 78 glycoside hydrolase catalytic domain [Opitutaceae bacterium]